MIISELNIPFYQFKIENWKDKKNNLLEIYSSVENILTSKDPTSLVYTDFGISKILKKNVKQNFTNNLGSIGWRSKELILC